MLLTNPKKTAVVVGAGFSRSLGVPAYAEVMKTIAINLDEMEYSLTQSQKEIDVEITKHIQKFLLDVFDCDVTKNDEVPSLEQVFTFIDLSANSGHNLGQLYRPGKLIALRRFLIYKLFLIIDKSINYSSCDFIIKLFEKLNNCEYISLNWDIVLEKCLKGYLYKDFNYGVDEVVVRMKNGRIELVDNSSPSDNISRIVKVHGSANWAYCDNCRKIFCMKDTKITKVIHSGIYVADIKMFYPPHETDKGEKQILKDTIRDNAKMKECPICGCSLDSHIATFSYNKSFRTHAFSNSWKLAERVLSEADRWIFIGYSLPDADFEFAHMLKYVQKRNEKQKDIFVIVRDDDRAKVKYEGMFGKRNVHFFNNGLDDFVANELGMLT